nr:L,D-transpeptidase family protein [Reyranella massiliensis]
MPVRANGSWAASPPSFSPAIVVRSSPTRRSRIAVPRRVLLALVCAAIGAGCGPTEGQAPRSQATAGSHADSAAEADASLLFPSRGKAIVVDIRSFELVALEDGAPVLRSRVIVGRPATPTPELLSSMRSVRFNPAWTPTPQMMRDEGARYVPPGPNNPLGQILFELDNDLLIFLHDTNDKALFNRTQRALSHGCIRVEQARPLAAWVLGLSLADIEGRVARRDTYSVPLPAPIPVYLSHTRLPAALDN